MSLSQRLKAWEIVVGLWVFFDWDIKDWIIGLSIGGGKDGEIDAGFDDVCILVGFDCGGR